MIKISKTKIEKKSSRKTNTELRNLIVKLKKKGSLEAANLLANPRRKAVIVNIGDLEKQTKEGEKVLVPGKVLGKGEIKHKITIAAFSFSQEARNKLKSSKIIGLIEMSEDKSAKMIC
ncbi:MAG: 50S ribosomal protein L18e [archaeon]